MPLKIRTCFKTRLSMRRMKYTQRRAFKIVFRLLHKRCYIII